MPQLGHALHDQQHVRTEVALDYLRRQVGVLQGVVQQRGDDRVRIAVHLHKDERHGDRVGNIRLAGGARLALVLLRGDGVGVHDFFLIQLYIRVLQALQELFSVVHGPPYPLTRRQSADLLRFALSTQVLVFTYIYLPCF